MNVTGKPLKLGREFQREAIRAIVRYIAFFWQGRSIAFRRWSSESGDFASLKSSLRKQKKLPIVKITISSFNYAWQYVTGRSILC